MGKLRDKVALVTGGASGIGRGIVARFVAEGARVAVLDINGPGLSDLASRPEAGGKQLLAIHADVTDDAALRDAVRQCVERFGRLDVLVNNAGIHAPGDLAELAEADWHRVMAVNLTGPFLAMKAAVRAMAAGGGGSIINLTSISARSCYPGLGAYGPSKAALENLTRQAAVEFAPLGIRVNAVSPGWVRTPLTEAVYQRPGETERRNATVPLGRIGTVEDVARLTVFLASEESGYITGESIEIDGGLLPAALKASFELARIRPVPVKPS